MPAQTLVEIRLVSNIKAMRTKPFVARLRKDGSLEFLRATIPWFDRGVFIGGKYLLAEGDLVISRCDFSTHKHETIVYYLDKVENGKLKTLAKITVADGTPHFEPRELENVYVDVIVSGKAKNRNKYVQTLIEYAKKFM